MTNFSDAGLLKSAKVYNGEIVKVDDVQTGFDTAITNVQEALKALLTFNKEKQIKKIQHPIMRGN